MTRSRRSAEHPSLRSLYNDRAAFEYWSGYGERIALHLKITSGGFYSFNASQLHDLGCRGQGRRPIAAHLVSERCYTAIRRSRAAAIEPVRDLWEGREINFSDSRDTLLARLAES